MKDHITGESIYTIGSLVEFYRIAARRIGSHRYRIIRFMYFAGGIALMCLGLYYGNSILFHGDGDIVSILLTVLGLYLGVHFIRIAIKFYYYFASRAMKSIPAQARCCYFSFEKEQIVISNHLKSTCYTYEQFGRIYETEQRFHFYINAYNGYILEKTGIQDGTADELRFFLNSKRETSVEQIPLDEQRRSK